MNSISKLSYLTASILAASIMTAEASAGQSEKSTIEQQQADKPARHHSKQQEPQTQQLTPELLSKVAAILSPYSPSSLTAADAKAINNAFRKAGIRRGPGQPEAIKAAGFDPEKIRSLDPPPKRKQQPELRPERAK